MTPELAAEKAAHCLELAADNILCSEAVANQVAIADAWTRLYTALHDSPPVSPDFAEALSRELDDLTAGWPKLARDPKPPVTDVLHPLQDEIVVYGKPYKILEWDWQQHDLNGTASLRLKLGRLGD
ncbi:hypothetical protein ACFXJ8_11950 [Nonomuraea sp. NPDC059194]|uniref:hypothetical protein n=1 Tax=Nonomuraea sp. NPDC059194 TaxID=3346764 RepID=UPI0036AFD8A4